MVIPKDHPLREFKNFLYLTWEFLWEAGAITAPKPDPTPVQYDIANYLQYGPRRKVIEAFRGVGKSWITSAYVCWRLLLNPNLNFLVVSASKDRSDQFSSFTLRLIHEMPLLQHMAPNDNQRSSQIAFDVALAGLSHSPSVKSVGITGQLTGSRADEIIADDVESLNNSLTQVRRERLSERIKEFDAILKPNGMITFLGTPQTMMSIYNEMPSKGYEVRIWPARIPSDTEVYSDKLAPFILDLIARGAKAGDPVDPKRFTSEDLLEREASYGRSGFALQFMLDTALSDANKFPLKLADLMVMPMDGALGPVKLAWSSSPELSLNDVPNVGLTGDRFYRPMWIAPEMTEYSGSVMYVDPSGRGSDEMAYAIVKSLHGYLFLYDIGGMQGGYSEQNLKRLAVAAKAGKVNEVIVESNFGDGMFTELLTPVLNKIHNCGITERRVSSQKEVRIIDTLEPVMNQHRLIINQKLIQHDLDSASKPEYSLFYQMTRINKERGALSHDDRLDALEGAVNYWLQHMSLDADTRSKELQEKALDDELAAFVESVTGNRPNTSSFIGGRR